MVAANPPLPADVYAVFSGLINHETLTRITNGFANATANNVTHLHVMFHSSGGAVGDGVALYNLFRAAPFELTLYNTGIVASIGGIAYLGALHRKISQYAIFMLHRTQCIVPQGSSARVTQTIVNAAIVDDQRTEAILRRHIRLTDERWAEFDNNDLIFTAEQAVATGVADEIAEFVPPAGTRLYNF
jgi:ATP-dependent Clp protease protease subunit